ncbi:hypothetical protein NQ317_004871 [Molorchus minor]|uniref:Uncharacterized protein n=1 Tax=Molorchus minor TaxID=1323400 RepID=A0ABQ9IQT6_9CUCU|nr:hypothetical protein NQ317_004871 [Molorchus minor]
MTSDKLLCKEVEHVRLSKVFQLDENYEKIIDCLTARFGREDYCIEVYLYDLIEMQFMALDTLGITSDKYAALLFPLIESCLPQELLRIWQRSVFNLCSIAPSTKQQ